jgi:threonine dehydratase
MDREQIEKYLKKDHKKSIDEAAERISPVLRSTPLIKSRFYSNEHGADVYIKPENMQITGAFKLRGAYNKLASLSDEQKMNGVITASAGNHAQGVAYSAKVLGLKSKIVMPSITPLLKVNSAKEYGAEVILSGDIFDESNIFAQKLAKENGITFIHPFDDYDIISGQGTIAKEILEELPDTDIILVPIGGGGLISGIGMYAKSINPSIKIIGVEPEGALSMKQSIENGKVVTLNKLKTSAEGVAVKMVGDLTFELAREYVDEIISVSEKDIMENVLLMMERHKLVGENSGVLGFAALRHIKDIGGKKIVCVLSGGNIDTVTISSIINEGMISRGRIMCFSAELPDRPGQLLRIAEILAELGANVIELEHNQFKALDRYSNKVVLEVTVETNGSDHIDTVLNTLVENGFNIRRVY